MTFWQGTLLGLIVGFVVGFLASSYLYKQKYSGEMMLAWAISVSWLLWHLGAGFHLFGVTNAPPVFFDVVAGGSVGFILGEKFFDYVSNSARNILRK